MNLITVAALAALSSFTPPPSDNAASVRDARAMLVHWQCSTWASLSGDIPSAELHFKNGLLFGRRFYEAIEAKQFTDAQLNSEAPLSVLLISSGPSIDFKLGRVFEYANNDAFDDVVKKSPDGSDLAPRDYIADHDIRSIRASSIMRSSNCSSLEFLARD